MLTRSISSGATAHGPRDRVSLDLDGEHLARLRVELLRVVGTCEPHLAREDHGGRHHKIRSTAGD
jgi:hypothetical protein